MAVRAILLVACLLLPTLATAASGVRGIHVVATMRGPHPAVTLLDGAQPLATLAASPQFGASDRPIRQEMRIVRSGSVVTVVREFWLATGNHVVIATRLASLGSGALDIRISMQADRALAFHLDPTFRVAAGAHAFAIGREPGEGSRSAPAPNVSPLPVLGLETVRHSYFVASGATWDHPLPGRAEPHLVIGDAGFAAPQIGTATTPVNLEPGARRSWRTILGRAPDAPSADRRYAVALGAQLAVAADEGGVRFAPVRGDLRAAARDRFAAIAFATAYWSRIAAADGTRSVTPAPHYAPGTWMRDSFWTILGLTGTRYEAPTEATILASYARATPRSDPLAGRVPLLIAAPSTVGFDDESGLYFLIRMERAERVLGIPADRPLAALVMRYILQRQVDGARFVTAGAEPFNGHPFSPNGWLDGYRYAKGDVITANQGLFVLALKAAARLGAPIPAGLTDRARDEYRRAYDPALGYMRWLASTDYRSPDVLLPEALSLYLWNEPLLDDRTVRATLAAQRWSDHGMRVLTTRDGDWVPATEFLNTTNAGHAEEPAGWYQNGGSWLLWEYLAAYAARRHGDPAACAAMRRSLAAEVAVEPVSKEFKLTRVDAMLEAVDPGGNRTLGSTDAARQGYGWNAAIFAFDRDLVRYGLSCARAQ